MIGSRKVKFSVPINWLVAIAGVAVALIIAYIVLPKQREILGFVAPVLGGAAALIAAFNAIDARGTQAAQGKRTTALDFIQFWLNPSLYHAKTNGRETIMFFKANTNVEDQIAFVEADRAKLANLQDMLNLFEAMSVAIQTDMADEEMCKRFFRSIVSRYWHSSAGYIRKRRAERENPRLYVEMEWLATRWDG